MKRILILVAATSLAISSSCSYDPYVRQGQTTGGLVGAAAGGLITDSWGGAAAGAVVGGMVGGQVNRNRRYY